VRRIAHSDVDLALVAELDEVDSILGKAGWLRDGRMPQRWHDDAGSRVDVLPATSRLIEAGSISFDGTTRMSLVGFDLALDHTVRVAVPGHRLDVEVACLSALVVLKIVAWLYRPVPPKGDG
jgi:predicted nucleotidyltransferase